MYCRNCGKEIPDNTVFCTYCGAQTTTVQQPYQQTPNQQDVRRALEESGKNKIAAGLFAILLGGFGIHKFYLGRIGLGIVYILFCWSGIPSLIALVEGIIYLTSSDEEFYLKYVRQ
ncbi:MAG TPA: TM2 domain-containing protein [Oscillospiraceae bacterium]|nr:TM2 domain-containing protein [Oscillospiraceae bacterium]